MTLPPLVFKEFWKILQNNYSDKNLWKMSFGLFSWIPNLNAWSQRDIEMLFFQEIFAGAMKLICLIFVPHPFLGILIFKLLFENLRLALILKLTLTTLVYVGFVYGCLNLAKVKIFIIWFIFMLYEILFFVIYVMFMLYVSLYIYYIFICILYVFKFMW